MVLKSLYCVECICGYSIESETNTLICPGCRRLVVIDWHNRERVDDRKPDAQASPANSSGDKNWLKL
jgi:hypothetical protein